MVVSLCEKADKMHGEGEGPQMKKLEPSLPRSEKSDKVKETEKMSNHSPEDQMKDWSAWKN